MKANEAPEKIYVNITHPISNEYTEMIAFENGDGIEYVRTDAFIEKAAEWLRENLLVSDLGNHNYYVMDEDSKQLFIENFRNYMKGE